MTKKENGITLVALVVTVILMLILAAISINFIFGDYGILKKTKTAVIKYDETSKNEAKAMEEAYDLLDSLSEDDRSRNEIEESGENPNPIKIGYTDISKVDDLPSLYGEITDFKSVPGVEWQLFYDDIDNIYLIASDYVPNAQLPCNGNEGFGDTDLYKSTLDMDGEGFCDYCVYFTYWSEDGVTTATTDYAKGVQSDAITENALTSKYLKWVASNQSSNNNNIKAVAFLMDTDKWKSFAGENYTGAKAIGGPTIEMFVNSYNAAHPGAENQLGTYTTINDENSNGYGYKVKKGSGEWTDKGEENELGAVTNMWCIHSESKARGMWMASPSSSSSDGLRSSDSTGNINTAMYIRWFLDGVYYRGVMDHGCRPVVAIPKSSIG